MADLTRREFVQRENEHLGRFLDVDHLVGWRRTYRCDCGFTCAAPGDIHDHRCASVQGDLFNERA
jgi:hypothetical protein